LARLDGADRRRRAQIGAYKEAAKARKIGKTVAVPDTAESRAEFIHRRMHEVEQSSNKRKGK
jgi:hypothetical protein